MPFEAEYSEFIKSELDRLDAGTVLEKKRAQTARQKIATVCQAPTSHAYTKDLPDKYGAVAVTSRFRLFFKIHQEHNVVFFAWMNDENHIHASGAANDSYQEFRRLLSSGGIQVYQHLPPAQEAFVFQGSWAGDYVYVEFSRVLSQQTQEWARSTLFLCPVSSREFSLRSIDVSQTERGLASELLKRTLESADRNGIKVTFDLFLTTANLPKSRHLLSKFGFNLVASDTDIEMWERNPGLADD